jgi:membrane protein
MSITSIRLREAWDLGGLTLKQLAAKTYQQIDKHETLDRAAGIAFYAMLSLVPFLSFLLAISVGRAGEGTTQFLALSEQFLPAEADAIIQDQVQKMRAAAPVGVLSLSFVILLWSSSGVSVAIMDSTNAAYGVRDSRPWWKRRLMAVVLTVVEAVLLIGALTLIVAGPRVVGWFGLGGAAAAAATVAKWIIAVAALMASFAVAFYVGPDVKQEWEWITPGSVLAVVVLLAASLGLRLYFQYGSDSAATYGVLAGVVLILLWLYVAALALLVGAEVNCVIEHAAPHGKSKGQKVSPQSAPGEETA